LSITLVKLTKVRFPSLPFQKAATKVLGRNYEIDVIFANGEFVKKLNRKYRGENKSTNVLSFALSRTRGEIVFDVILVKREALQLERTFRQYLWYLFLHALLHLKGYQHESSKKEAEQMQKAEEKLLKFFNVK